jgi:ribosome-associated heat shock protein Hsp15
MAYRLDKYVWAVRLAKTRSQAAELISKGKIKVNDQYVKPSREPKVGEVICVLKNTAIFTFKITQLLDKRVGAKLVLDYLTETTTEEEKEKHRLYSLSQSIYRENGSGKPTKKDRRDLNEFFEW